MSLGPGTRLGPYEIVAAIGAGGMGEVYRARDTRLKRDVALKILPESFASDPDRLARFQREAEVLASLSHPNIAGIYGLEESDGIRALVMELVEGETLADRISRGPIPLDEALPIAKQIAEALEAAHEQGVIHRDLKPANIKIRPDGTVRVLDFGLAKFAEPITASNANPAALSMSPTITSPALISGVGVLLGTAAYMAPEQARGKPADKRSDIWAFGCVLYEMLTACRAFEGDETAEVLARVIEREPDVTRVPRQVRRLVRSCLEKDRKKRLQAIADMHLLIEQPSAAETPQAPSRTPWSAWLIAVVALLAAVALAVIHFREIPPRVRQVRSTLLAPANASFEEDFAQGIGAAAISPDGMRVVFGAHAAGATRSSLWVRPLDALAAQPLAGTEGASFPFWSPDSRFIAFFADRKLKKIDASGGPVLTLVNDAPNGRGGTWNREGVIVYSPSNVAGPLMRVAAAGGIATQVSRESGSFPWFLPDGQHFLFQNQPGATISIGSLDGAPSKRVIRGSASNPFFSQGYLLFVREGTLMAQPFDIQSLATTGDPAPIAEQIQSVLNSGRAAAVSVSETGALIYREGTDQRGFMLTWVDRQGHRVAQIGDASFATGEFRLSPDHKRVAMAIQDPNSGNIDIWVVDITRGTRTRMTFDPGVDSYPVWSPDGRSIVFRSNRKGHLDLYRKSVDSVDPEELLYADEMDKTPSSWSPDGQTLLYQATSPTSSLDVFTVSMTGRANDPRKPTAFLSAPYNERAASFSPDGRWVLYNSDESSTYEVYVAPFAAAQSRPIGKRQVSMTGTTGLGTMAARWGADGREIFYVAGDGRMIATEVTATASTFAVGTTRQMFPVLADVAPAFDVSADGQRFLVEAPRDQTTVPPITLVQNWLPALAGK